mmetsp:Transcript_44421/g.69446  ORF Transcript_44421/g.69446 Transcript_44421/m.69446 type:complete len:291 (-) Transcript_44421:76-948(-)|eukprot:CAMPEP_0184299812 /NCGR_PEP_ID=MMETSP1049-20130417/10349_1 /TAXON_ID=77928 /ORGANISM="Proteomonas sulcata, Strain CCMP704" /LENGTH=290 /DNA_ID=CAMNT_0026610355 /DNA_START=774 /DNA_END=1646 /DNA_ORIENTATION=+
MPVQLVQVWQFTDGPLGGLYHQYAQVSTLTVLNFREVKAGPAPSGSLSPIPQSCSGSNLTRSQLLCSTSTQSSMPPQSGSSIKEAGPATEKIEIYVTHGPEAQAMTLEQQNTADLMGQAVFYCSTAFLRDAFNFSMLTLFELEVDSAWGVYQGCNIDVCSREMWVNPWTAIDPSTKSVGRLTFGLQRNQNADQIQCGDTNRFGTWFSTMRLGKCAKGAAVGTDGCTWRILRSIKTIDLRLCPQESKSLRSSCMWWRYLWSKMGLPPTAPSRILKTAFTSDDPALGGCPSV